MEMIKRIAPIAFGFIAMRLLSGCGSGMSTPPPVVSVSFSGGSSQTIGQGQSVTITAVVANDPSSKGVTWTLAGSGALSKQTSTTVEYDAPANVPSNSTATVTATSVADPVKSANYTVNLAAISVSVSPASANVAANVTQDFMATVQNDTANAGVTWSLTQNGLLCSPKCGTVAPATTSSGGASTYTPPISVPANATVTLTAISVADSTKSAPATITIVPPLPISVSVSPSSSSVAVNSSSSFTASVLYDAANAGIAWTLTQGGSACSPACGTLDPTTTASGTPVTYLAPASVPANPTVTLTATSVTDPSKAALATVTVTLPPISVAVSPASVLIGVNATQQFTAVVKNDGANKGVTWALTQNGIACSSTCGSTVPKATASSEATTYTAPSAVPTNNAVAIAATSVSDSGSTGGAAITLTNGTVKLAPAKLAFGRVDVNTTSSLQITLTNTGMSTLTIASIDLTGAQASLDVFSQTNTCAAVVEAGAACFITISFKPTTTAMYAARLTITDSSADSSQQVSLQGKGKTPTTAALRSALSASMTVTTPLPTGPSSVGTRLLPLVDASRRDPYVNAASRELLVRFWYPANLAQGCKPAEYTSPRVWSYFSELIGVRLPVVSTNSCTDAPVADSQHPVVVFTHGYTGTFTDYTFLFEDLASRGYVVASVDHTYEATAVEFPDGRFVESIPGSHFGHMPGNDASELAFAVSVRLADLKFVVSELKRLNEAANGPFGGKLETSRIALGGHSLGAVTALLAVEADTRIKAGVGLDGVVPETPAKPLVAPIMLLAAGREQWSEREQYLWDKLRGPRFAVDLRGAEHLTPSDLVWLAAGAIKSGTMGSERTIEAIRNYVAAFLDANLRSEPPDRLLIGPSSDYPDAIVTTQSEPLCCRK